MKKACHLLESFKHGGAENVACNYAIVLKELGIDSIFIAKDSSKEYKQNIQNKGFITLSKLNKSDIKSYIKNFQEKESIEVLDKNDADFESVMLGLRTDSGIKKDMIYEKNKDFIDSIEKEGYLKNDGEKIVLTNKGFFVSNKIISSLVI